jgi:hypothetical protein
MATSKAKKSSRSKSSRRKYSKAAGKTVERAMRRRNAGTLRRGKKGHGGKVKSRAQAIAIGLSEAREKGEKVPPAPKRKKSSKKSSSKRASSKSSSRKSSSRKSSKRSTAKRAGSRSRTKRSR